MLTASIHD